MKHSARGVWLALTLLVSLAPANAQQYTSQKWDGSAWVTADKGTYVSDRVTTQAQGEITWYVLWREGQKVLRIRADDPSLSSGEKDLLDEAEAEDSGVEVEIETGPNVESVTAVP
ncbi:MAG: hypothetical protein KF830_13435 [Planctomycetes bacterium]|nr:hypothetical protein [Planctomycetota bacterium]